MSSSQIEKAIRELKARRESLGDEAQDAALVLTETRKALVSGKAKVEAVTQAQSTYTALVEALRAIDAELAELSGRLTAARASERLKANEKRIAELRASQKDLQGEFDTVRAEANEKLSQAAGRLLDLARRNGEADRELRELTGAQSVSRGLIHRPLKFGDALGVAVRTLENDERRRHLQEVTRRKQERAA